MALPGDHGTFRFRDFVLDVAAYELRRNGHPVRLERQPMDLLLLLVGRRGQLISRSQIVDALWAKDVFVDVENGVNTAIRKLRQRVICSGRWRRHPASGTFRRMRSPSCMPG
jgi:DNA-binding winged helix-turn-helix (wHTH) protein